MLDGNGNRIETVEDRLQAALVALHAGVPLDLAVALVKADIALWESAHQGHMEIWKRNAAERAGSTSPASAGATRP